MSELMSLSSLAAGQQAVVREFLAGAPAAPSRPSHASHASRHAAVRLREMGVLVGTPLTLVRRAPLGDPIEIKVRGYSLTLRKSEAEHILVEPTAPAAQA